jgi:hypothetical protein
VLPGVLSWLVVLAPIWLSVVDLRVGVTFASVATVYFVLRAGWFGVRSLANRARVLNAMRRNWLADLESLSDTEWRQYRVILLVRAFRESNQQMLRDTLESIHASNWPRDDAGLRNVEVVFSTEVEDAITPPLVEALAREFAGRVVVRQIAHPATPGHLPGPSSSMHFAGRWLYQEARETGISPDHVLVADFDSDTDFHPQYLPCLVYHFATDLRRHRHAYQPVVLFTSDYWHAPLHSRLAAVGTSVLTLGWNRRPDIAFTGAAASLSLLKSVDFWPTNSHSQDSGVELRFRLRYGREFHIVGLPVPLSVYPVMVMPHKPGFAGRARAYLSSLRALFRQSARWREGPLDEFVESVERRSGVLAVRRLWSGLERDTLTLLPTAGLVTFKLVPIVSGGALAATVAGSVTALTTVLLTIGSVVGIVAFAQVLLTAGFVTARVPLSRLALELALFYIAIPVIVPLITAVAGLKTSSAYLLGKRPRGHFLPTPK